MCFYWGRAGTDLLIQVHLPREELFEGVQLLAEVFFHHSKQRDFNVLQLGLQRGKLSSLLIAEESDNLSKTAKLTLSLCVRLSVVIAHLSAQ